MKEINITNKMLKYRNCIRELWNNTFLNFENDNIAFSDVEDYFSEIKINLFQVLIAQNYFKSDFLTEENDYIRQIKVIPNYGPSGFTGMIANYKQTDLVNYEFIKFKTQKFDFRFVDFFDWTTNDVMDCQYVMVTIVNSEENLKYVNSELLLDANMVKYYLIQE